MSTLYRIGQVFVQFQETIPDSVWLVYFVRNKSKWQSTSNQLTGPPVPKALQDDGLRMIIDCKNSL